MSYIRTRGRAGLGAVFGPALPPAMIAPAITGETGSFLDVPSATGVKSGEVLACPPGYTKSITGSCTKLPDDSSIFSGVGSRVADFFGDWFKAAQTAKGKAAGAAEGLSLVAAQQQSPTSYLPYVLIGGGVLAAVLLLRK